MPSPPPHSPLPFLASAKQHVCMNKTNSKPEQLYQKKIPRKFMHVEIPIAQPLHCNIPSFVILSNFPAENFEREKHIKRKRAENFRTSSEALKMKLFVSAV